MIRSLWRDLVPLLPDRGRVLALVLAVESLVAGILEAVLLVLVVSAALSLTDGTTTVEVAVPLVDALELGPGRALGLAGAAGLLMLTLHLHTAHLSARMSAGVMRGVRDRSLAAFSSASWARQSQAREGELQETVSTLARGCSDVTMGLAGLLSAALALAALLGGAFAVDPLTTAVVLVFGALLILVLRPIGRLTRNTGSAFVQANSGFTEAVSQWSSLAMEHRMFGVELQERNRLADQNRHTADRQLASRFVSRAGGELYRDLAILFLVGAVAGLHALGDIDLTSVGAVVLLIVRSLSYAQMANSYLQQVNETSPNLHAFLERVRALEADRESFGEVRIDRIGPVELADVTYAYGPDRPGIEEVTLAVEPGESIGIVGRSGGGKTTLVQVLLRLRLPTSGTISVDGLPYAEVHPDVWARLVSLVPQEPRLFQGTVAENIAYHRDWIDQARIERAAADAHVLDDIVALPDGFATELGPRGAGLSGGQKQRVAIARALAGDPQLLVLDEPTSALDIRSEDLFRRTIGALKGRVTLVIVAHRISTLTTCDRVVAMEAGRIKLVGTLDEAVRHLGDTTELGLIEDPPESPARGGSATSPSGEGPPG